MAGRRTHPRTSQSQFFHHDVVGALPGGLGTEDDTIDPTTQASSDAISLPKAGASSGHLSTGTASTTVGTSDNDALSSADGVGNTTPPLGKGKKGGIPRGTGDSVANTSAGKAGILLGGNTSGDDDASGGATADKKAVRVRETGSGGGDAGSGHDQSGEMVTATDTPQGNQKGVANSIVRKAPASESALDAFLADVDDPASATSIQDIAVEEREDISVVKDDAESKGAQAADGKYSVEDSSHAKDSVLAGGGDRGRVKHKSGSGASSGETRGAEPIHMPLDWIIRLLQAANRFRTDSKVCPSLFTAVEYVLEA